MQTRPSDMTPDDPGSPPSRHTLKIACSNCALRNLCMPLELESGEAARLDRIVVSRIQVKRGDALFRSGDAFNALYAIRAGFFKTFIALADGRDQITGFQMAGEIIGLDGIVLNRHASNAVALEDAEVCVMPFERVEALSREIGGLQQHMHRLMSREIVREHGVMLLLGRMRAEERLATFLLDLSQRLRMRGFSGTRVTLCMTREEIGSYLGMTLETVSRTFSRLAADRVLAVSRRQVLIRNEAALRTMANLPDCQCAPVS